MKLQISDENICNLSENNGRNSKIIQIFNEVESMHVKKNVFTPKLETKSPKNYTQDILNKLVENFT